jgi:hypothetical protein
VITHLLAVRIELLAVEPVPEHGRHTIDLQCLFPIKLKDLPSALAISYTHVEQTQKKGDNIDYLDDETVYNTTHKLTKSGT